MIPQLHLNVQYASQQTKLPTQVQFSKWAKAALNIDSEVMIRIVGMQEGCQLNKLYRGKDYATNVLTFPLAEEPHLIGDIILCAPVIEAEAKSQNKSLEAHYAHLTVHGILHLHGYDHEIEAQAELMEGLETAIVIKLGYASPYLII